MKVFLASLGVLFAASLVGFFVIRIKAGPAWSEEVPPLPRLLWLSTAVIIASSFSMSAALNRARSGHSGRFLLSATAVLGLLFLGVQAACWSNWLGHARALWFPLESMRYALAGFFILTGLHALHVIGGVIPLTILTLNACRGRYATPQVSAIHYVTMYWHFLGAVWIVLFATLLLGT